jgi:fructose-1,6-bisphosphatase/inositol monophosphatase family enzyme
MFDFCRKAGQIAEDLIKNSDPDLKADHSVITLADKKISDLAHEHLSGFISSPGHVLIEEEDPRRGEYLNKEFLDNKTYIWSVDPIDGTRLYANQIPLYGVSIGLIKEYRPWLGIVYFPGQDELFYCDGDNSFYVKRPFAAAPEKAKIGRVDHKITSRSLFLISDMLFKRFNWDYSDCRIMATGCATVNLCWPLIGRGCGSIDQSHLWDIAGAWPIVRMAGMEMRNFRSGKVMDKVDAENFLTSPPWKLKDYYIVSTEENFALLRNKVLPKN